MTRGLIPGSTGAAILAVLLIASMAAQARAPEPPDQGSAIYAVVLARDSVAEWHRKRLDREDSSPTAIRPAAGKTRGKVDFESGETRAWLRDIDAEFEAFRGEAARALGRDLPVRKRFRNVLNGFTARLAPDEVRALSKSPNVRAVLQVHDYKPRTDAGPAWIGADEVWGGLGAFPASRGEGIIVGIVDTGINWNHVSFSDPGGIGGHDFVNPRGSQLGLCSDPEVLCNDKLIGVYDFIEDDPSTPEVEENTKGADQEGHGTHVASTAVGNTLQLNNQGVLFQMSGVAPNANLVSYRVCYEGDPDDPDSGGCPGEALVAALDQAVIDGVDVINYSLGRASDNPWTSATPIAMLNAFGVGVLVVTSASNDGPAASSIGSPADAPWVLSVGNATHNRLFGATLENLTGGDSTPPDDIFGATFTDTPSGFRRIVHAKDYGNALCGVGTEELGTTCFANTGATNPFPPGTFNGEIVVCDRGQYGRIEKGRNVQLAGAAGMILANTEDQGESLNADDHCLPALHIGRNDGDVLREWLASGSNHMGQITEFDQILDDSLADRINASSSRGPNRSPMEDVLKPEVFAPGTSILGASLEAQPFEFLTGTSMSSPHVAGAAALLIDLHPDWSPSQVWSALQMTANPDHAIDFDNSEATPFDRGAGRIVLGDAARAGLYLAESQADFTNANPSIGGMPRKLNLPGLVDDECMGSCSFQRTVTDMAGGANWTSSASGFPAGVNVTVTPSSFTLGSGASRTLQFDIDLGNAPVIGSWVYGDIALSAAGLPDAHFTVAVFANGGDLPEEWVILSDSDSGWKEFQLDGLADMPQATFGAGGLQRPQIDQEMLPQDPTRSDPFDGGEGVMTIWHEVPEGALWLHTETLPSEIPDLDLYVGRDDNEDGVPDFEEQICSSTSFDELELCDVLNPEPGHYWVVVQNWQNVPGGTSIPHEATLESAVIVAGDGQPMNATGPGKVAGGDEFDLRLGWNHVNAGQGEEWLGAVSIGTHADRSANIGVIPVHFHRSGIVAPQTTPLFDGMDRKLTLAANGTHDRAFIDIPPGASQLVVTMSADSADHNNDLALELRRVDFSSAFGEAPLAAPAPGGAAIVSASGSGGNGPQVSVNGLALAPGRWYVNLVNNAAQTRPLTVRADITFGEPPIDIDGHLWVSENRPGISQGIDFQTIGPAHGLIWYTFTDHHDPAWYLAAGLAGAGNTWVADLLRFTNDAQDQQFVTVGKVSMTQLDVDDAIFTWDLFGASGSERMNVLGGLGNPCPVIDTQTTSVSGFWGKQQAGLGGASVLYIDAGHAEIHYLYDAQGQPVWLEAAGGAADELTLRQYQGNCPTCSNDPISSGEVGLLTHDYEGANTANWMFDYLLIAPLSGDIERFDDDVVKLSDVRACD